MNTIQRRQPVDKPRFCPVYWMRRRTKLCISIAYLNQWDTFNIGLNKGQFARDPIAFINTSDVLYYTGTQSREQELPCWCTRMIRMVADTQLLLHERTKRW